MQSNEEEKDLTVQQPLTTVSYGRELLSSEFLLRSGMINFNHGSFGTVPRRVMDHHIALLQEQESCPEIWFRETYFKYIKQGREKIASLIRAQLSDVVLVENASTAVNAILRSFPFQSGDIVLVFSSAYRMVKDTLRFLAFQQGVVTDEMPLPWPMPSSQPLLDLLRQYLAKHQGKVKLCVFSHISSMPTLIEPINELTQIAKDHGSQVLIDGAHAPGVLDIDVEGIGCDYYTGNCHKWLFAPKGSAFLWTSRHIYHPTAATNTPSEVEAEDGMHPQPVVISSTGRYDYVGRFDYTGTRDYVALCSLPKCFDFIEEVLGGFQKMRHYCRSLLIEGCEYLAREWRTTFLAPLAMCGFMANVILPSESLEEVQEMQRRLLTEYSLTMVFEKVRRVATDGKDEGNGWIFFIRVSAQVYLDMRDFHLLAGAVKKLLQIE